jgi:hypothetical protein
LNENCVSEILKNIVKEKNQLKNKKGKEYGEEKKLTKKTRPDQVGATEPAHTACGGVRRGASANLVGA